MRLSMAERNKVMFKDIKKQLRFFVVMAVSMFLLPTVLLALGVDSLTYQNVSSLFIIGGVITSIISGIIGLIIIYKSKNADRTLQKAELRDQTWDEDRLKYTTRFIFYKIMNAWNSGNISVIEDFVTAEYLRSFRDKLAQKTDGPIDDIINSVDILETRIISCQDYLNNKEDKFVGYIKWKFSDELVNTDDLIRPNRSAKITWYQGDDEKEYFQEVYYFIRVSNDWMLNETDDKIGFWKLLRQKNYYQDND